MNTLTDMTLRTNNVFISISITVLALAVAMAFVTRDQGPFFGPKTNAEAEMRRAAGLTPSLRERSGPAAYSAEAKYRAEFKASTKREFTSLLLVAGCALGFAAYGVLIRPKSDTSEPSGPQSGAAP